MSELINQNENRIRFRWQLLAGVSALALGGYVASAGAAMAEEADHPAVWIELGGQLERADGGRERFSPSFLSMFDPGEFASPVPAQRPPRYAVGGEIKASFSPQDSDWVFSAAVRYGRSNNTRALHQELPFETATGYIKYVHNTVTARAKRYSDTLTENHESHAVVDFRAGKDLGLGLFGSGSSTLNVGIRFAQIESHSKASIGGDPDFAFSYKYITQFDVKLPLQHWHLFSSTLDVTRSFHGLGPSVAWDNSAPILGNADHTQVTIDFGINGAVLFGRQKANVSHQTTGGYHSNNAEYTAEPVITYQPPPHRTARSRSVVIPNVGGFAGLSFKFPNAKVSLGYRADVFFGAIDGGIDARKTYDRSFYGPFANFSIGL
jgi:hypothetical protein